MSPALRCLADAQRSAPLRGGYIMSEAVKQAATEATDVRFQSGIFPKYDPSALDFEDDSTLIAGMLANLPRAWREFQKCYDRLIHRCITKVTRRFSSIVAQDDVREVYATLYLSLLANDK